MGSRAVRAAGWYLGVNCWTGYKSSTMSLERLPTVQDYADHVLGLRHNIDRYGWCISGSNPPKSNLAVLQVHEETYHILSNILHDIETLIEVYELNTFITINKIIKCLMLFKNGVVCFLFP